MKIVSLAVVALFLIQIGCAGPKATEASKSVKQAMPEAAKAPGAMKTEGAVVVVEAEDFDLANVDVKNQPKASGGKVIVMKDDASKAEKTIQLPAGRYNVTVYALGADEESDAFNFAIGSQSAQRLYPEEKKVIEKIDAGRVEQKADGPCKITITFAEPKAEVDRVELQKIQ